MKIESSARAGRRRRIVSVATLGIASFSFAAVGRATTFTDPTGDNYGPSYVDLSSVVVTNDADNITFQINLNPAANLFASDGSQIYGKYQIGFQTGEAGNTSVSNPYGNPIGISGGTGMDYWVGSWADNSPVAPFSGDAQLYHYTGSTATLAAGIGTNSPYIPVPVSLTATSTTITIPVTSLGLAAGDQFKFDVWTTFGQPGGQSAYDALGKPTLTTDPGTPYSPVTPYDSSTAGAGGASTLLSYTVSGTTTPTNATFTADADANWSVGGNWSGGVAPNGVDHIAVFGSAISVPRTVTVDGPKMLGTLTFDSAVAYTLAGTDALTMDVSTGTAAINVNAGSHAINAPLTLADDTTITVTPAASTLSIGGSLAANGHAVTTAGAGTISVANVRAGLLNVNGGTVRVQPQATSFAAAGTSVVSSLSIGAGGKLDLANNALVIDYTAGSTATLAADVRQLLASGKLSSSNASSSLAIGYVDNAVGTAKTTFGNVNVDASSLLVGLTLAGDANLDRSVTFDDLLALAKNYGASTNATWQAGDFNYDGATNFSDLLLLAKNYSRSAPASDASFSPAFAADWALAQSLAPEPGALGLIASSLCVLRRRRAAR